MKIKDNHRKKDIITKETSIKPVLHVCFSFEHLTSNNNFGIKQVASMYDKGAAYEDLIQKLCDWGKCNANELKQRGKKLGLEKIPYSELTKPMKSICDNTQIVSKDSKICVFQFYNHNYRLLCKDDINHPNLMHVIAFDTQFSSYNHG